MKPRVTDVDRAAARLLIETFRPRLDVYAERLDDQEQVDRINKWMADKGGSAASMRQWRTGDWKPYGAKGNRAPVTVEAIAEHVAGRRTLGFYPLHPDGVCNSVSVDFDNHRGTRVTERDPREDYDAVSTLLLRRGVRFIGHHSRGGRGYWIHLLPPVGTQASVARAVLQRLLDEAGVKHIDAGGTVDSLFPKQDRVFAGTNGDTTASPGNLFCLPLSRRWLAADPPGSHLVGTDPRDLNAQMNSLRSYL
jgi:hypothetical protein